MLGAGKISWQSACGDADVSCRRRGVAAPSDEARFPGGDDCPDRSDIAIADRREGIPFRAAVGGVDQNDVRRFAGAERAAIEAIHARIASGRRSDGNLGCDASETRQVRDRIEHAERHDPAAGRRIGAYDQPVERFEPLCQAGAKQSGAQITGGADLQRDVAFADDPLEVAIRHVGPPLM